MNKTQKQPITEKKPVKCLICGFEGTGHELLKHLEHCYPEQKAITATQDAFCTEHGREGCFHKFPYSEQAITEKCKGIEINCLCGELHANYPEQKADASPINKRIEQILMEHDGDDCLREDIQGLLAAQEQRVRHLEGEIDRLASFLLKHYQDKIEGSAVDTAIKILSDQSEK